MATLTVKPASTALLRRSKSVAVTQPARARRAFCTLALLGPDGKPGSTTSGKKKFITREEEPEQYWGSKIEASGGNPMKDPLAIIGVLAIFFPFIFLGIAIATGYVDLSVYR